MKKPIVSKAQLEASGYDNLRDFMNAYEAKDGKFVPRANMLSRKGEPPASSRKQKSPIYRINLDEDAPKKQIRKDLVNDKPSKFSPDISKETKVEIKPQLRKKDPIVSKAQLKASGYDNLRDFMNAYEHKNGEFVPRRNKLSRRGAVGEPTATPSHYLEDYKKGGKVKSSASKRADGCAIKGKTRGKFI